MFCSNMMLRHFSTRNRWQMIRRLMSAQTMRMTTEETLRLGCKYLLKWSSGCLWLEGKVHAKNEFIWKRSFCICMTVFLLCSFIATGHEHCDKHLLLCSSAERTTYRIEMTWGGKWWQDRQFGVNYSFNEEKREKKEGKKDRMKARTNALARMNCIRMQKW